MSTSVHHEISIHHWQSFPVSVWMIWSMYKIQQTAQIVHVFSVENVSLSHVEISIGIWNIRSSLNLLARSSANSNNKSWLIGWVKFYVLYTIQYAAQYSVPATVFILIVVHWVWARQKLVHNDGFKIWPQIHTFIIQKSSISHIFVCQELDDEGGERLLGHEHLFE